jgi:hypothetical protein
MLYSYFLSPKWKAEVRKPKSWKDNLGTDLKEAGCDDLDWILLAQDGVQWRAFVSTIMNLRFHKRRGIL